MSRFLVVGAGIIGAAIAERLTARGEEVVVVDGGLVAGGATAASFGWINASFYADEAHFRLRREGLRAWRRVSERTGVRGVSWTGTLTWEGDLDAQEAALYELGYEVTRLDGKSLSYLEPALRKPPDAALAFHLEGVGEPQQVTQGLMDRAVAAGAQLILGQRVRSLLAGDDAVVGVETDAGLLPADHVILATGTGTSDLLAPLGLDLPMLDRPADMVVTAPAPSMLGHILVTEEREIRQDKAGRFWLPSNPRHQVVTGAVEAFHQEQITQRSLDVLMRTVVVDEPRVEQLIRAKRPVPGDGLPVVGETGIGGLTVAVMHSGVTLAALVGELVAHEIEGEASEMLAPYRLARFQKG
ncbi:MAG: FAD-binding oxidoreductase [Rhodobacteraceae bacterium]|nr:FAD-binding oxidoreductase [Paracoccaceae bacterium]